MIFNKPKGIIVAVLISVVIGIAVSGCSSHLTPSNSSTNDMNLKLEQLVSSRIGKNKPVG